MSHYVSHCIPDKHLYVTCICPVPIVCTRRYTILLTYSIPHHFIHYTLWYTIPHSFTYLMKLYAKSICNNRATRFPILHPDHVINQTFSRHAWLKSSVRVVSFWNIHSSDSDKVSDPISSWWWLFKRKFVFFAKIRSVMINLQLQTNLKWHQVVFNSFTVSSDTPSCIKKEYITGFMAVLKHKSHTNATYNAEKTRFLNIFQTIYAAISHILFLSLFSII